MKIGFIGIGVMGNHIVNNMLANKHEVYCYTRTKSKAQEVINNGATYLNSYIEVADMCDVIFTIVGYPKDVEEVYLGEKGFINTNVEGKIFVEMTTSTPTLAIEIYNKFKAKGASVLDAPVSGGDMGAKNATMTIMCGGDETAFNTMLPIFEVIGKTYILQGKAGCGQHTKMCNQIALAANMCGVMEYITYATKVGMDPQKVFESIAYGSAGSSAMTIFVPRIFNGDLNPGFYIKHFVKDLKIAIDEMQKLDTKLPMLEQACKLYETLENEGLGDLGTQALIKYYLDM